MNPSFNMTDPFNMHGQDTTEGAYLNPQGGAYAEHNGDHDQRVGGFASMPVTNGPQYHAPQSALQEVHYSNQSPLAMAPPDTSTDAFALHSNAIFPNMSQYSLDRLADFNRATSFQPPAPMAVTLQHPMHHSPNMAAFTGSNYVYSPSYAGQRGMNMPLAGINDFARSHGYVAPARPSDLSDSTRTAVTQPSPPVISHVTSRSPPSVESLPFDGTAVVETVVADFGGTQQVITPEVDAKMNRGFFIAEDGKWTCYRRNYFSVTCGFSLTPWVANPAVPLYLRRADQSPELIRGWGMAISAIVNGQYGETRELVQHTPKRDKQSEHRPERVSLRASPPISLSSSSSNSNGHGPGMSLDYSGSFGGAPQLPQSHTFERLQFQKATANNGKRRAQQQFYNVVVELHAEVADPIHGGTQWVLIARRRSDSMVVRGRSPGHYKDSRRDSTASMGSDGRPGAVSGSTLSHSLGATARLPPQLYEPAAPPPPPPSAGGNLPYGRAESPMAHSSASSTFDYAMVNDTMDPMDTLRQGASMYQEAHDAFAGVPNTQRATGHGFDPVYSSYGGYGPAQNHRGPSGS